MYPLFLAFLMQLTGRLFHAEPKLDFRERLTYPLFLAFLMQLTAPVFGWGTRVEFTSSAELERCRTLVEFTSSAELDSMLLIRVRNTAPVFGWGTRVESTSSAELDSMLLMCDVGTGRVQHSLATLFPFPVFS